MSTGQSPKGRGAADNPANRFIPLYREPFPDYDPSEDPAPRTLFFHDTTRSALAENDSPDIPFRFHFNPYRGCEHGCSYCLGPDTPILYADMTWRRIGDARPGDVIVGFDEYPPPGSTRKYRQAVIEAVWWSKKPSLRLVTANTEIVTTAEHLWLDARYGRWCRTDRMFAGRLLRRMPVVPREEFDQDYRAGYITGLSLGDGTFRYQPGWRSNRLGFPTAYWRVALADEEPLTRLVEYLRGFGVEACIRPFCGGASSRREMKKVEVRSLARLATVQPLLTVERDSRGYRRGFLAGFFDAEGCNSDSLRISQVDRAVLERVRGYAAGLGFEFRLEPREGKASTLRLVGRLHDRVRFFCVCRPAIRRKIEALYGREMELEAEPIREIVRGPVTDVVDIQTSTRTFLAAGVATHNCFARPTHEYLSFSAGLDFETRIMVKEDAPRLLRKALASPKWEPQPVGVSGVTDAYQPIERRAGITRRCLEVFAEFRNPVAVVTKSALVARDRDVLAELAKHQAAAVFLSVTTLDAELARVMEPRAAAPHARLRAIRELTDAGVPCGVMFAPVVPGLNDHEAADVLAAAAGAGAVTAGFVFLRLPYGVKDVFGGWLDLYFPQLKAKVLGRIRELRGGRLNVSEFGKRMGGEGAWAEAFRGLFRAARRKAGMLDRLPPLSTAAFRRPGGTQHTLFE